MMEHLWSRADADSGNPQKVQRPRKPLRHLRTAAVSCIPLRPIRDGKEGVSGSSPEEGLQKRRKPALFSRDLIANSPACSWMEHFLEPSDFEPAS
jgi:hypothetical protein